MRIILALLSVAVATFAFRIAEAAPSPDQVSGELRSGSVLVVRGSGFGTVGPQIALFEDFESAAPGQSVRASGPYVGTWSSVPSDAAIVGDARSGNGAFLAYDDERAKILRLHMPETHREIFISYWVRIPPNTRFPGNTSGVGQFSSDSSWKLSWLMHTPDGHGDPDLYDFCLPTYTGSSFQLAGNAFHASDRYIGSDWWSWNTWMRVSVWIRDPILKTAGGRFEAMSADKGLFVRDFASPVDRVSRDKQMFDVFNIPGWIRQGGSANVSPLYDDIYLATGSGAAARVELADSSTYAQATRVELLLSESWSGSEVRARIPRGLHLDGHSWYVFVTDENGVRSAKGLPLTTQPGPEAPAALTVH